MPQLTIIYDQVDPPVLLQFGPNKKVHAAQLFVTDGLAHHDIYALARKLAELLLEQIDGHENQP